MKQHRRLHHLASTAGKGLNRRFRTSISLQAVTNEESDNTQTDRASDSATDDGPKREVTERKREQQEAITERVEAISNGSASGAAAACER